MDKKKLLFVISQFYKGGAETSLLNLLKKLDENTYEIDFLIMDQRPVDGATSLIPDLPGNIHVFDAYRENQKSSFRFRKKLLCSESDLNRYPVSALLFSRRRQYDWAFHVGEWWAPDFVTEKVTAAHKAAWIHTDISSALAFSPDAFFAADGSFERYIFVSQHSLDSSVEAYPFLRKKAVCIHNFSDSEDILAKSAEETDIFSSLCRPIIVTCANIRKEKNHMRQLRAMKILSDQGVNFTWVNIGSTADVVLTDTLKRQAAEYGLQDRFLLLGAKSNPYPYMASADAVAVLSDYESWSMVITEAMTLGVPVIATKTSGALEQIDDGVTGVLTEFDENDIADKIGNMLRSSGLMEKLRANLCGYAAKSCESVLQSFSDLTCSPDESASSGRKMLYVIDKIGFRGGAHIATVNQLKRLQAQKWNITVFSMDIPTIDVRISLPEVQFISLSQCKSDIIYRRRLLDCLTDSRVSRSEKHFKFKMSWAAKIRKDPEAYGNYVLPQLTALFSGYDVACVMSEASPLRRYVADAEISRKIQYIHTDYAAWCCLSDWTRKITADDESVYNKFDQIVLLSDSIRDRFVALYPSLSAKTTVNRNVLPQVEIREKAVRKPVVGTKVNFVSVGRFDSSKAYDRLLRVLEKLYDEGYRFSWTIIGDGDNFRKLSSDITYSRVSENIRLLGALDNPYPFVREAHVFALFSRYEGLPNTIYEALILGIPVIATNVGGIDSQVIPGENGWLVQNSEKGIHDGLVHIFTHPEEIHAYKQNLKNYEYDNQSVLDKTDQILCGNDLSE